jgi:hypothetical protein
LLHRVRELVGDQAQAIGRPWLVLAGAEGDVGPDRECASSQAGRQLRGGLVRMDTDIGEAGVEGSLQHAARRRVERPPAAQLGPD